jgi:hypothetical protein
MVLMLRNDPFEGMREERSLMVAVPMVSVRMGHADC